MEQCSVCRFWLNWDTEQTNLGECHRFPPQMATVPMVEAEGTSAVIVRPDNGGWPLTFPDDWCGEFQRLPESTPATPSASPKEEGNVGPSI